MTRLRSAAVIPLPLLNGTVLVGSDAHISPGKPTTAVASLVVGVQAVQAGFDLRQQ
jgi:hypothetical protein